MGAAGSVLGGPLVAAGCVGFAVVADGWLGGAFAGAAPLVLRRSLAISAASVRVRGSKSSLTGLLAPANVELRAGPVDGSLRSASLGLATASGGTEVGGWVA